MAKVNTVLGSISADQLGMTLMHEHLVYGSSGWQWDALAPAYDRQALGRACADALQELKVYGVKTVVDATPSDSGRDAELDRIVSDKTGINIVLVCGYYTEANGGAAPYWNRRGPAATQEIAEIYVKEITQGIGDTGIRAGVIKVATGYGKISPYEEKLIRAAIKAHKETGVPIITHTEAGTMGPEQADLLISEGVDPKRIMIGHMCGNANLEYHFSVLDKGAYIAFDRLGVEFVFPDRLRKTTLIGLLGMGYANRIMLSQDYTRMLGRPRQFPPSPWSYTHIFKDVIPSLEKAGVSDDKIRTMLVENPRHLFGGE